MQVSRTVTVADGGVTKRFTPGQDLSGVSPVVLGRLRRAGAFGDSPEALGVTEDAPADLDKLTVAELKALAEERSINLGDASRKADIIAAIEAASE